METLHEFTTAEALEFIENAPAGTEFALHFNTCAAIAGRPGELDQHGCYTYVNFTRNSAKELAGRMLRKDAEGNGRRIRLRVYSEQFSTTYWL